MAFNKRFFDPTGSGSKGTKIMGIYQSDTDNRATVNGANYFNSVASEMSRVACLLVVATDAVYFAKVSVSGGVVTLAAMDLHTPAG